MDCLIYASFFCQRGHCVAIYFWLVKEVDSLGEGVVRGDELFCYHSQIKCYQVWSSGIDWNRCLKNNQKIGVVLTDLLIDVYVSEYSLFA